MDIPSAATTLQWYAETIDKLYGEIGPTGPANLSLITREPIGVVGAIVPWNYPMIISAWKLGAALATGNSVVLKPASQSPLTALRLAELAVEAELPDGVLNVVTGPGAVIGDALARHPGVDKIAFTGSTEVGLSLLRAVGASNVKAISLELGGKSPQVVPTTSKRPPGDHKIFNSGHRPATRMRLVVHRSVRELVGVAALGTRLAPGEPSTPNPLGRPSTSASWQGARLRRRCEEGRGRPAGASAGNGLLHRADDPRGVRTRCACRARSGRSHRDRVRG